jgi:hypothetical protein
VRYDGEHVDEPSIVRDLRILIEASRKLREEVSDMVSHRPRVDLRAHLDAQRRPTRTTGRRPPQVMMTADERTRKRRK